MMDTNSLFDKLKSMGVQLGSGQVKPPVTQRTSPYSIENVVKGSEFTTPAGRTYLTLDQFPLDYQHGHMRVCTDCSFEVLAAWSQSSRILRSGGQNLVFLDTETTGLAGGTGTYAFLVGIGYQTADSFELVQFFMRDPAEEAALLTALEQWLARFEVVVTFNGKTFDIPLLNNRYELNGIPSPFVTYEHVDILQIARKLWRDRLPSRALPDLEKEIVHYQRTAEEVPGWMIPQLYFDYLRDGDARPLAGVFYHNAIDILSLAALFSHVTELLKDPIHQDTVYGLDLAAIARLYEEMGWIEQAAVLYAHSLDIGDLPQPFFFKTIERYARMNRRQNDWSEAVALWRTGAEHGMVTACIELAKFYEHQERNYEEAYAWTKKALEYMEKMSFFEYPSKTLEQDLHRRITRLAEKVNRS